MVPNTPRDVPPGLLERVLQHPVLRPERVEAGRRRAALGALDADVLAAALLRECRSALQRA